MNSLKEVYNALEEVDHEKVASQAEFDPSDELVKQASEYYEVGQVLAHQVFGDLVKEAVDEEMPAASDEEKKKKLQEILAKARGEAPAEKKESEGEGEEEGEEEEKKASVKAAILQKMAHDPEYVSALIAKHYGG